MSLISHYDMTTVIVLLHRSAASTFHTVKIPLFLPQTICVPQPCAHAVALLSVLYHLIPVTKSPARRPSPTRRTRPPSSSSSRKSSAETSFRRPVEGGRLVLCAHSLPAMLYEKRNLYPVQHDGEQNRDYQM
eukprot:TRINITY_DN5611_c0_g4_i1.p1 TRINITY_DN5611_c0_g4~~TRINITY_DN5611_c0_g4_i1.p1  ORF type:complete len:132 (-),score=1.07 TRINITY_DN5611_c0_g4_i1:6-401(-)